MEKRFFKGKSAHASFRVEFERGTVGWWLGAVMFFVLATLVLWLVLWLTDLLPLVPALLVATPLAAAYGGWHVWRSSRP